jgi:outer membrane protein assembly factor BamD
MTRPSVVLTLSIAAACLWLPTASPAAVIYRSNEGWSVEGDENSQVEGSAAEQMRKAEKLEAEGNTDAALGAYRALVKRYGLSVLAPKAQRKVGLLYERSGQWERAFDAYDTYLSKYPRGDDFDQVVESMFKISKLFLEGEKKRLMGVPIAASMDRAREMAEAIVKRAPFSKWAPLAQFNIGQADEKQGKYPEAIAAYQQVVSKYPNDPVADDALYQVGFVRLREHREGSYDRASAAKAREAFEDFIARYPDSEKVAQARENIKTLEGSATKGSLQIAKFYDKTKQYRAAVIYYNDVIQQQPGSTESEFAKQRIAQLREQVGEDALRAGPERTETGARALARRKLQAKVDTVSRPDYVGPMVAAPPVPVEVAPGRPKLRTSPSNIGPIPAVEPALPSTDPILNPAPGTPEPPLPTPIPDSAPTETAPESAAPAPAPEPEKKASE